MTRHRWSTDPPPPPRPWSKLPPIAGPFTRIPDDPHGRRMCRCDCGWEGPTLGTGLHLMSAKAHRHA